MLQVLSWFVMKQVNSTLINQVTISEIKSITDKKELPTPQKPQLRDFGKNTFTKTRHHQIHPSVLSSKWGCGLKTAKITLKGTTQLGIHSAIGPLTRRYCTDILQLHY